MKKIIFISKQIMIYTVFGILILLINGCSNTKEILNFNTIKYPASMSAFLYDSNYQTVMKGKELQTLYSFEYKKNYWTLAYGIIHLTKSDNLYDSLNAIVERYKGDGIINLTITINHGIANKIYATLMYLPSYIPIFPSNASITVSGEVVKLIHSGNAYLFNNDYISKELINKKLNNEIQE